MRNIFLFIRQYFNLITFVILQIICIVTLSKYSKTHEAFFSLKANEITGKINSRYSTINNYFKLDAVNKQLALENAQLHQQLHSNFITFDTSIKHVTDTTIKDTLHQVRKYTYLPANVVINNVSLQYNFIQLERGEKQGVKKDMGVVGPNGIVGKVVSVSDNYCMVMSLLNRSSKVSAMLKNAKNQYASTIGWTGQDANYVTMENVSKAVVVKKGDTVVTSSYSASFPSMLMIGTVADIKTDAANNNYTLKIKTATDFNTLQYVNIIANSFYGEQHKLDSTTYSNHLKAAVSTP